MLYMCAMDVRNFKFIINNKIIKFSAFAVILLLTYNYYTFTPISDIILYTTMKNASPNAINFKNPDVFYDDFFAAYKPNPNKFLIYSCRRNCTQKSCFEKPFTEYCGGLGDRLLGIISGFIWAILTNRTFLIDSKFPCPLEEYYDPNIIQWNKKLNEIVGRVNKNSSSSVHIEMYIGAKQLILVDRQQVNESTVFQNLFTYYNETDVILVKSNYQIIGQIFTKNIYNSRLKQLGFNNRNKIKMKNILYHFYYLLFKLTPRLKKINDDFLSIAKPSRMTKLVCIQVRLGGTTDTYKDEIRMEPNHTKVMFDFVKHNITEKLNDYKVYITTDRAEVETYAKIYFGESNMVSTSGTITHIDRDTIRNRPYKTTNCSVYDKTYIDFHLLQYCDTGLVSRSGFGVLGIQNRKILPTEFYIYRPMTNEKSKDNYIFEKLQ